MTGAAFGILALRATIVALGAIALASALRNRSAAVRHAVYSFAVAALLVLPLLTSLLPSIDVPVLPPPTVPMSTQLAASAVTNGLEEEPEEIEPAMMMEAAPSRPGGGRTSAASLSLAAAPSWERSSTRAAGRCPAPPSRQCIACPRLARSGSEAEPPAATDDSRPSDFRTATTSSGRRFRRTWRASRSRPPWPERTAPRASASCLPKVDGSSVASVAGGRARASR